MDRFISEIIGFLLTVVMMVGLFLTGLLWYNINQYNSFKNQAQQVVERAGGLSSSAQIALDKLSMTYYHGHFQVLPEFHYEINNKYNHTLPKPILCRNHPLPKPAQCNGSLPHFSNPILKLQDMSMSDIDSAVDNKDVSNTTVTDGSVNNRQNVNRSVGYGQPVRFTIYSSIPLSLAKNGNNDIMFNHNGNGFFGTNMFQSTNPVSVTSQVRQNSQQDISNSGYDTSFTQTNNSSKEHNTGMKDRKGNEIKTPQND